MGASSNGRTRAPVDFSISGTVRLSDRSPAVGVLVELFGRDIRHERKLGGATTDGAGHYLIEFVGPADEVGKGSLNLLAKALDSDGSLMTASDTLFDAPRQAVIDLSIPRESRPPLSLVERIQEAVGPSLQRVPLAKVEQEDVSFLAGETGFAKRDIARFILAQRLMVAPEEALAPSRAARRPRRPPAELPAEFWFALLGGPFFAYDEAASLEQSIAQIRRDLARVDAAAVRKVITSAVNNDEVPARLRDGIDAFVAAFLELSAREILGSGRFASFAKEALAEAGVSSKVEQLEFARRLSERGSLDADTLNKLEDFLGRPQIDKLLTSYRLAELTGGDFTVVKALKQEFKLKRPDDIRRLAKQSEAEWVECLERLEGEIAFPLAAGPTSEAPAPSAAKLFATTLAHRFRETFPTAAFAGGLERALKRDEAGALAHGRILARIIDANPDFDLGRTPIDAFLDSDAGRRLGTAARDPSLRNELRAAQRVFKIAPTYEAARALLEDGLHSAQSVYRLGESEFARRYSKKAGLSDAEASAAWRRAADTAAAALTIVSDLKALDPETLPAALQNGTGALANFPNWESLFRSGDYCHCEHCRSTLSPAAYFADLLMFLRDRRARAGADPNASVGSLLSKRRSDLGYIELNCANALTTLPYVDIVCEVLEAAVAGDENDVELAGFTAMPADPAAAKAAAAQALADSSLSIGSDFSISQVDAADPNRWVVHGEEATYLLKKKASSANFLAQLLPNSKTGSAALRAYPAYVNSKAYLKLKSARFPFRLPFDLELEEVGTVFRKAKIDRWELMSVLADVSGASESDVAASFFGISCSATTPNEKSLIIEAEATDAAQQRAWGEENVPDWKTRIAVVATFLQKTGLEYEEMLALFDLPFIDPGHDIRIIHEDASCDTEKKHIEGLDAGSLDRLVRFLRLWRKLSGWKLWELDLALRSPGIGNGALDEACLVNLFYLVRLKVRLGARTSIEDLCALFSDLETTDRFEGAHERRGPGHYQRLFLNDAKIRPIDSDFAVEAVTAPTSKDIAESHKAVLLAALGRKAADLALLLDLRGPLGTPYIDGKLTLANLSLLWRHSFLAKALKLDVESWRLALRLLEVDQAVFADAKSAFAYLERVDRLLATGFEPRELSWLLLADRSSPAAPSEAAVTRFLSGLWKEIAAIRAEFDPALHAFLDPPADTERLEALLSDLLQELRGGEAEARLFADVLRDELRQEAKIAGLPAGFSFPAAIAQDMRIHYDEGTQMLRLVGHISDAQEVALLGVAGASGNAEYRQAIEAFHRDPRLALRFAEPALNSALSGLPAGVAFTQLADRALAQKISYDGVGRELRFAGIMSAAEKAALEALSSDPAYRAALDTLFNAPRDPNFAMDDKWLSVETELDAPLRGNLAANLAKAVRRALARLSQVRAEQLVLERAATFLKVSEEQARRLLTHSPLLPEPLLQHLTVSFALSSDAIDTVSRPTTFAAVAWTQRAAKLWSKWKLSPDDLERLARLAPQAQLFDFASLPLGDSEAAVPIDAVLRLHRLVEFETRHTQGEASLLQILIDRQGGALATPAELAAAAARASTDWTQAEIEAWLGLLDPGLQADYFAVETWERLAKAVALAAKLNAQPQQMLHFAGPAPGAEQARALKHLLSSKLGEAAWSALSTEIQDALRERKRDALACYLLSKPQPPNAPSGKWRSTNDLYAYFLLDVEMGPCQLTSRLVQATNSVQLFVQRCLMGLEPEVAVSAEGPDGDSAWGWWQWMSKYRLWEANCKVFLWPENWIEPELNPDRSSFFKELERELLQGEVNEVTVEAAFVNYLQKLDKVSKLEVAAFHQEDAGDDTVLHVFGRSAGAEPHELYYRSFDYRRWTPWAKVELDVQSDYLTPFAVNGRLFLFWPVFTQASDEQANSSAPLPSPGSTSAAVPKTAKRLKMRMAVSDYRRGQWSAPRLSKRDVVSNEAHYRELSHKHFRFFSVDRTAIDGRFCISFDGSSVGSDGVAAARMSGAFEIAGCSGAPEPTGRAGRFDLALRPEIYSVGYLSEFGRWKEFGEVDQFGGLLARFDHPQNDFTLQNAAAHGGAQFIELLKETPGLFAVTPPWHQSYMDRLLQNGMHALSLSMGREQEPLPSLLGAWLPFFYNDKRRTFLVLPAMARAPAIDREAVPRGPLYYPELKLGFRRWEAALEAQLKAWAQAFDLAALTAAQRATLEAALHRQLPGETAPPFSDADLRERMVRAAMRFMHLYLGSASLQDLAGARYHFLNFYHPFVCDFVELLQDPLQGVAALMRRQTQFRDSGFSFQHGYWPSAAVVDPTIEDPALPPWTVTPGYPKEIVDFSPAGSYASYNWELFFHAPLLIANALSRNQRFEEAQSWYHHIFNPIGLEGSGGGTATSRFWVTRPFFETSDETYLQQRIETLLRMLSGDASVPGFSSQARDALLAQVLDWRAHPYEPHRIAAYRTVAYQKTVVMKYLDNLLAWADHLFRQDSMESINEAIQLYVLATDLLGPRPRKVPPQVKPAQESFNELEKQIDAMSNALVEVENLVPPPSGAGNSGTNGPPLPSLYFCIPHNERLLGYWDKVADRLYKIRHCLNVDGVARQLALFEPPIDPALLVKARAAGLDIGTIFTDLSAPLPLYRFFVMLQKANEVCNDVKALGAALLSALEKKDGEALAILRQEHELRALDALRDIREKQVEEAETALQALQQSKAAPEIRRDFYRDIDKISGWEEAARISQTAGIASELLATVSNKTAAVAHLLPKVTLGGAGVGGSPVAIIEYSGQNIAQSSTNWSAVFSGLASISHSFASLSGMQGGHERRWEEWKLQEHLAEKELQLLGKQIAGAELRLAIAAKEQDNLLRQIEDAQAIDDFMSSKYTNEELYQWHVGQIAETYFASYRLAHDLAKRTERCFRFELGVQDSDYISYGYWDSLRKGLLAGDKLQHDLRRLEAAYLEQNRRDFELTRHASLAQLDPLALIELRETGRCRLSLPEELFDLDYPGHYFRTIASVSLSLPCVAGPYTTISCTLRLLSNSIRISPDPTDRYPRLADEDGLAADDPRFIENNIPVKSIAASSGQNDSGMFEFSFHDERYLPFEGAGAISRWSIELFHDSAGGSPDFGAPLRQFNYDTISDVILHMKYTTREDAGPLKDAAIGHLREYLHRESPAPSFIALDLRRQFASHWSRFLSPADPQGDNVFELPLSPDLFPARDSGQKLALVSLALLARGRDPESLFEASIAMESSPAIPLSFAQDERFGRLLVAQAELGALGIEIEPEGPPPNWLISLEPTGGLELDVEEMWLVVGYRREG